jgi:hypothetical protein
VDGHGRRRRRPGALAHGIRRRLRAARP